MQSVRWAAKAGAHSSAHRAGVEGPWDEVVLGFGFWEQNSPLLLLQVVKQHQLPG